ncbi:MAG: N-acetylneuraminate synthase family protein [Phycisphaeraceae bacterium]
MLQPSLLFAPATATSPPKVLVIAELGVNHDGQRARAMDMVTMAAAAGADAIKLQLFDPRHLLSNQAKLAAYQKEAGADDPFTMLDRLKLTAADLRAVRSAARETGLAFILTPFSLEDVPALADLDVDAVKIASPDAVNTPLLRAAAALGKPMLISTGTCTMEELADAAALLRSLSPWERVADPRKSARPGERSRVVAVGVSSMIDSRAALIPGSPHSNPRPGGEGAGGALLQCVSSYPTADGQAAINGLVALRERFGVPVGYSDHTRSLVSGAVAVAAGACVIEKHFTYDRQAQGPDHAASLDPVSFTHYVDLIREAQVMLGPIAKRVLPCEQDVRAVSRQSVCAVCDLSPGHVVREKDVTVRRPGTGIPARELERVVGRRLRVAVRGGDLLRADDLE